MHLCDSGCAVKVAIVALLTADQLAHILHLCLLPLCF